MDNYEEKALQLDKELAVVFGLADLSPVPRWTQEDDISFRLMVEHDVEPQRLDTEIAVYDCDSMKRRSTVYLVDFPDKLTATRFAICQAVVNKLKVNV